MCCLVGLSFHYSFFNFLVDCPGFHYSYNHHKLRHQNTGRISWPVSWHGDAGAAARSERRQRQADRTNIWLQGRRLGGLSLEEGGWWVKRERKNASLGDFYSSSRLNYNFIILCRILPKHILNLRIIYYLGKMCIATKMRTELHSQDTLWIENTFAKNVPCSHVSKGPPLTGLSWSVSGMIHLLFITIWRTT